MKGFPNGTPPELVVKEMELLYHRPEYKTNTRVVHWSGGQIEDGDDLTIDEIVETIKENNSPSDLAVWANRKNNTFTIAWVDLESPKGG